MEIVEFWIFIFFLRIVFVINVYYYFKYVRKGDK